MSNVVMLVQTLGFLFGHNSTRQEALPGGGSHVARLNFKTSRVGVY